MKLIENHIWMEFKRPQKNMIFDELDNKIMFNNVRLSQTSQLVLLNKPSQPLFLARQP
jgi:hypothetical protein